MGWLRQIVAVTSMSLRTLRERFAPSAVAVIGIALVVMILVTLLSIAEGFEIAVTSSGSPDTAVVLRSGSSSETMSNLSREDARIVGDAASVRSTSPEAYVVVDLPKKSTGTPANVPLRGVEPGAFEVRKDLEIVEGRNFTPGRREVIAGRGATTAFGGLTVGTVHRWGQNDWTIVGIFEAGGGIAESELWCDLKVLQPAYRRGDSVQAVYAELDSPAAFTGFKDALTADPRLNVNVLREDEFYSGQSEMITATVNVLGGVVGILMGIGAAFGAILTMYMAVSERAREIATLRALGFKSGPVVISVMVEALVLGLIGGTLGGLAAYFAFNGFETSTLNWASFSQVAFAFRVTPRLLILGVVYALAIGFVGGFLPAFRAARMPVATALRQL